MKEKVKRIAEGVKEKSGESGEDKEEEKMGAEGKRKMCGRYGREKNLDKEEVRSNVAGEERGGSGERWKQEPEVKDDKEGRKRRKRVKGQ